MPKKKHGPETIYMKTENGKYVPVGNTLQDSLMRNGLWLVDSKPGVKSYSNLAVRLCNLPAPGDVQKYAKAFLSVDAIVRAIKKLQEKKGFGFYNCSLADFAEGIVDEMYLNSTEQTDGRD